MPRQARLDAPGTLHHVIVRIKYEWQDRDYVLSWFGDKEGQAKQGYRQYVQAGIAQGRRPELVGGGLIRFLGGWSEVLSLQIPVRVTHPTVSTGNGGVRCF